MQSLELYLGVGGSIVAIITWLAKLEFQLKANTKSIRSHKGRCEIHINSMKEDMKVVEEVHRDIAQINIHIEYIKEALEELKNKTKQK